MCNLVEKTGRETPEAGLDEILSEDAITQEAISGALLAMAQARECELRELGRLITVGVIQRELGYMGICCDPMTGELLAVKFVMGCKDVDVWIRPGESFELACGRLWRVPTDKEVMTVKNEAKSLGCGYGGWQMSGGQVSGGHLLVDLKETKSSFVVVPGRPVFDALLECRDKFNE